MKEKKTKATHYQLQIKIPIELAVKMKTFIAKNYPTFTLTSLTEESLRKYLSKEGEGK